MMHYHKILDAENELEQMRRTYLRRWGWNETSSIPGALWMWRRDFADVDAEKIKWYQQNNRLASFQPYGVITAPTDIAIRMTLSALDEQPELWPGED